MSVVRKVGQELAALDRDWLGEHFPFLPPEGGLVEDVVSDLQDRIAEAVQSGIKREHASRLALYFRALVHGFNLSFGAGLKSVIGSHLFDIEAEHGGRLGIPLSRVVLNEMTEDRAEHKIQKWFRQTVGTYGVETDEVDEADTTEQPQALSGSQALSAALYRIAQGVDNPQGAALEALVDAGEPTPDVCLDLDDILDSATLTSILAEGMRNAIDRWEEQERRQSEKIERLESMFSEGSE